MLCGIYTRFVTSGFVSALICSFSVCAQAKDDGCPAASPANPQSVEIVIDSLEFQEDAGLTPDARARLIDELRQKNFHGTSGADTDWQSELRNEIRAPLAEQDYSRAVVDFTSGLIRAEARRLHYWVSVRIESGQQYRLGEVRFENAAGFTDKVLRSALSMQEGDLFSTPKVFEGLDNLQRLFGRLGYIDFTSQLVTSFDEKAHRIDLTMKLYPGEKYRVRSAAIHGLDHATEEVLRWKLEAGQVFDATTLNQFLKDSSRTSQTGAPSYNDVSIVRDAGSHAVDVIVERRVCPRT